MKKTIKLHELSKEIANVSNIKELAENALVKAFTIAMGSLPKKSPVDTGHYAKSWGFKVKQNKGVLYNEAPHAAIIEYGARPHWAPIKPLLEWSKRKLGDPSQPPNYSDRVWAMAKAVQKKIAEKGQDPKHILENEWPEILENIYEDILQQLRDKGY